MDKEFIILGKQFIKYTSENDNEWVVTDIIDLTEDVLKGIVERVDKTIFVYDRHNPKDTRVIVGETDNIVYENGIKATIKWNELGKDILSDETRYPSVELAPNIEDPTKYDLIAIAMVGEPASKEVDKLELSILKEGGLNMDEMIKELVEKSFTDPESMRKELTEKVTEDATLMPLLIDAFMDAIIEHQAEKSEDDGTDDVEVKENIDLASDSEDDKEDDKDASKEEEVEVKTREELTALAYEHGVRFNMGVPTAESLSKAIDIFLELKDSKKLKDADKKEIAFNQLKFVTSKKDVSAEELSAYKGEKPKELLDPATQFGDAMSER
ncbi:MAG: hypothetical protein ACRC31_01845 [Cetobacterium sp.]